MSVMYDLLRFCSDGYCISREGYYEQISIGA